MLYEPTLQGDWVKNSEVQEGQKVKLMNEVIRRDSRFSDDDGNPKKEDIVKVKFQGIDGVKNMRINRATLEGLILAYGKESKEWIGKILTAHPEKTTVAGKRVVSLYLIPDGFELKEDNDGYLHVVKIYAGEEQLENDEIKPDEIPF